MLGREFAGEDAEWAGSVSGATDTAWSNYAIARDAVEHRRLDVLRAVGADAVGTRRIQCHHDDVERLARDAAAATRSAPPLVRSGSVRIARHAASPAAATRTMVTHRSSLRRPELDGFPVAVSVGGWAMGRLIVTADADRRQLWTGIRRCPGGQ